MKAQHLQFIFKIQRFLLVTYIIDDDRLYQFGMKRMLHHVAVETEVKQFYNGMEAIQYLQQNKDKRNNLPDIIFLDINMPLMNGWQFLDTFKNLRLHFSKQILIYMITSSVDNAEILRAAAYKEIRNYIIKPISFESMREIFSHLKPD